MANCVSGPEFRPYEGYRYRPHSSDRQHPQKRIIGNQKSVRVVIFRGPATMLTASGYIFTGIKGGVKKGSGKFTPSSSGTLVGGAHSC